MWMNRRNWQPRWARYRPFNPHWKYARNYQQPQGGGATYPPGNHLPTGQDGQGCYPLYQPEVPPPMPRKSRHNPYPYYGYNRNRRRSHLDDVFLPNYDVDECEDEEQERESHSPRQPVLTDVKIEEFSHSSNKDDKSSSSSNKGETQDSSKDCQKEEKTVPNKEYIVEEEDNEVTSSTELQPRTVCDQLISSSEGFQKEEGEISSSDNNENFLIDESNNNKNDSEILSSQKKKDISIKKEEEIRPGKLEEISKECDQNQQKKSIISKVDTVPEKMPAVSGKKVEKCSIPTIIILSSSSEESLSQSPKQGTLQENEDFALSQANAIRGNITINLLSPQQKSSRGPSVDSDVLEKTEKLSDLMGAIPDEVSDVYTDVASTPLQKRKISDSKTVAAKKRRVYSADVEDILTQIDNALENMSGNKEKTNSEETFDNVNKAFEDMFSDTPEKIKKLRQRSKSVFDEKKNSKSNLKRAKSLTSLDISVNEAFVDTSKDDLLALLEASSSFRSDEKVTILDDSFLSNECKSKKDISSIPEGSLEPLEPTSISLKKWNLIESPIRIKQKNPQRIESSSSSSSSDDESEVVFHRSKKARRLLESSEDESRAQDDPHKIKKRRHSKPPKKTYKSPQEKLKSKAKAGKIGEEKNCAKKPQTQVKVSVPREVITSLKSSNNDIKSAAKITERRRTYAGSGENNSANLDKELERRKLEKRVTSLFGSADVMHLTVDEKINKKFEEKACRRSSTESTKNKVGASGKDHKLKKVCKPLTVSIEPLKKNAQKRPSTEQTSDSTKQNSTNNKNNVSKKHNDSAKPSKTIKTVNSDQKTVNPDGSIKKGSHSQKKVTKPRIVEQNILSKCHSIGDLTKEIIKSVVDSKEKSTCSNLATEKQPQCPKDTKNVNLNPPKKVEENKSKIESEKLKEIYISSFTNFSAKKPTTECTLPKKLLSNFKHKVGKQESKAKPKTTTPGPNLELPKLSIKKACGASLQDDFDLCCYPLHSEARPQLSRLTTASFVANECVEMAFFVSPPELGEQPVIATQTIKIDIEVKKELDVVDLTKDDVKTEQADSQNSHFITLYRAVESTDVSEDCLAVAASIDAKKLLINKPNKIEDDFKVEKKEEPEEEQPTIEPEAILEGTSTLENEVARNFSPHSETSNSGIPVAAESVTTQTKSPLNCPAIAPASAQNVTKNATVVQNEISPILSMPVITENAKASEKTSVASKKTSVVVEQNLLISPATTAQNSATICNTRSVTPQNTTSQISEVQNLTVRRSPQNIAATTSGISHQPALQTQTVTNTLPTIPAVQSVQSSNKNPIPSVVPNAQLHIVSNTTIPPVNTPSVPQNSSLQNNQNVPRPCPPFDFPFENRPNQIGPSKHSMPQMIPIRMPPPEPQPCFHRLDHIYAGSIEHKVCNILAKYTFIYWAIKTAENVYEKFLEQQWRLNISFRDVIPYFANYKAFSLKTYAIKMFGDLTDLNVGKGQLRDSNFWGNLALHVAKEIRVTLNAELSPIKVAFIIQALMQPYWVEYLAHPCFRYLCNALMQVSNHGQARTFQENRKAQGTSNMQKPQNNGRMSNSNIEMLNTMCNQVNPQQNVAQQRLFGSMYPYNAAVTRAPNHPTARIPMPPENITRPVPPVYHTPNTNHTNELLKHLLRDTGSCDAPPAAHQQRVDQNAGKQTKRTLTFAKPTSTADCNGSDLSGTQQMQATLNSNTANRASPSNVPTAQTSDFRIKLPFTEPNNVTNNQATFNVASNILSFGNTTVTSSPNQTATSAFPNVPDSSSNQSAVTAQSQKGAITSSIVLPTKSSESTVNSQDSVVAAQGNKATNNPALISAVVLSSPQSVVVIQTQNSKSPVTSKINSNRNEVIVIDDDDFEETPAQTLTQQESNEQQQQKDTEVVAETQLVSDDSSANRKDNTTAESQATREQQTRSKSQVDVQNKSPTNEIAEELLLNDERLVPEQQDELPNNPDVRLETDIIDLTWIDEIGQDEIEDAFSFMVKKEECQDNEEHPHTVSPADSGMGSPGPQAENTVYIHRACFCDKVAVYFCQCASVWYCSKECQEKDWETHKYVCQKV